MGADYGMRQINSAIPKADKSAMGAIMDINKIIKVKDACGEAA